MYLTDLLERCHKVFVTGYCEGQKHVERLEAEREISMSVILQQGGGTECVIHPISAEISRVILHPAEGE